MSEPSRIDRLTEQARAGLVRIEAEQLDAAVADGAQVIDIRPVALRERDGELPGALVIDRNVLEWRLDPTSPHRLPEVDPERPVVVMCDEGYASSLAAATLRSLGLDATDLAGGYQALLRR